MQSLATQLLPSIEYKIEELTEAVQSGDMNKKAALRAFDVFVSRLRIDNDDPDSDAVHRAIESFEEWCFDRNSYFHDAN